MEDEEILGTNPVKPPKNATDSVFGALDHLGIERETRADLSAGSTIYENATFGKSQYDKNLVPSRNLDLTDIQNTLEAYRSRQQPNIDKFGNVAGRLVNIIPEAVGGIAAALDFEDYFNQDDEVGNWLTDRMNEIKEDVNEALPIYRQNRGKPLDVGDSSWWFENGSSLVNSIGGFAITGGVVGKGIQGLSKLAKIRALGAGITGAVEVGGTALALNQAEGILEAGDVYKETYQFQIDKLTKEGFTKDQADAEAKQLAADAAALAINTNRINILLNLSSASLFLKKNAFTRNLLSKPTTGKNLGRGVLEGGQEAAEEVINFISGQRGKASGRGENYTVQDVLKDIASPQAAEAAFLGFLGGLGQTIVTTEGVNRISKTTDPETGERMSVKKYNDIVYNKQKAVLDEYGPEKFNDIYTSFQNQKVLEDKLAKELGKGNLEKANTIKELMLDNQAYTAFKNGTGEVFEQHFKDIQTGEQKEGYEDNYKEVAQQAINKIKKLEEIYQKTEGAANSKELYFNRALALHYEDNFDKLQSEMDELEGEVLKKANRITGAKTDDRGITTVEQRQEPLTSINNVPVSVKKDPFYKEYQEKKKQLINTIKNLSGLQEDYVKLATKERAQEYEKEIEKQTEDIQDKMDKDAAKVETEAKKEAEEQAKQQIVEEQKKKETIAASEKELQQDSEDLVAAKSFQKLVGEKMNLPLGDGKTIDATVKKVTDTKVILEDIKGNTYTIDIDPATMANLDTKPKPINPEPQPEEDETVAEVSDSEVVEETVSDDSGSKIIAVDEKGIPFSFISKEWFDYQLNPVDKKGTPITFKVNFVESGIRKEWDNAIKGYQMLQEGNSIDDKQKQFLIDHLPINVVVAEGVEAPLATQPRTEGGIRNFNTYDRMLRTNIVNAILDGKSIEEIQGKIKDQKSGDLMIDTKEDGSVPENSVLELDYINNDISKIDLYVVNQNGDLQDKNGKTKIFNKESGKGELYLNIKRANGKDFHLKLNVKRVNEKEANILYDLYELMLRHNLKDSHLVSDLDNNLQSQIRKDLQDELKVIPRSFKELTIKDVTDFLIWDGSDSSKSKIGITGGRLDFGPYSVFKNNLNDDSKSNFIDWVTNNKRRHIRFKRKANDPTDAIDITNPDYLKYLLESRVLNTNAVTGVPTFQGDTSMYVDNNIQVTELQEVEAEKTSIFDQFAKKFEKSDEKIRNSENNFVPLQEVENLEAEEQKKVPKKNKKKLTKAERKKQAAEARERMNKKC